MKLGHQCKSQGRYKTHANQPCEGPSSGLLRDCEKFGKGLFEALQAAASPRTRDYVEPAAAGADTLLVPTEHAARLQLVVSLCKCRIYFPPIVRSSNDEILLHGTLKTILLKCHDKVLGFTFLFPYQNINVFKNCRHV